MGLNVRFDKDYAAEFTAKWEKQDAKNAELARQAGITVPIGQPVKKDDELKEDDKPIKGFELEHQENDGQGAVEKAEEKQPEDADGKVGAKTKEEQAQNKADEVKPEVKPEADQEKAEVAEKKQPPAKLTKEDKKKIEADAKQGYIDNLGYNEKDAKKEAKVWRKNEERRNDFERREVFLTKEEETTYKKANPDFKKTNTTGYIHNKELREYLRANGITSSDKIKEFALVAANITKKDDTETTYYMSHADVQAFAKETGLSEDAVRDLAHHCDMDFFNLPRRKVTGAIAGIAVAGATAYGLHQLNRLLIKNTTTIKGQTAGAEAHSAAGTPESGAIADAAAGVKTGDTIITTRGNSIVDMAAGGLGGLLGTMVYNKIVTPKPEKDIINPFAKPVVETPEPEPTPAPQPEPPAEETCESTFYYEPTCTRTVEKGDNWYNVAQGKVIINGKPAAGNELRAYTVAQRLRYGITNMKEAAFPKVGEDLELYSDFSDILTDENLKKYPVLKYLQGAEITFDCDGNVKAGKIRRIKGRTNVSGDNVHQYEKDCHGNVTRLK